MKIQKILCFVLIAVVPLSGGDDRFAKTLAGILSYVSGQPFTENQLEEIAHYGDEEQFQSPKIAIPLISTYASPRVMTTSGEVIGTTNEQAHAFYEIPYAEPPVEELRYQPPRALQDQESTVISAERRRGLRCPQFRGAFPMNEDCLVLSVYSPLDVGLTETVSTPVQRLPVLVYIHGGAFTGDRGTSEGLDGSELAAVTNIVVVTINYRLGALGFLVHKEDGYPDLEGNQGLKDQQMALQWVQDNIENFGGDKAKVTIAGNSAGGQSVMFHTLSAISEPLYNNAIQQSNPAVFSYQTPEESLEITNRLLTSLNCNESLTERECLMSVSSRALTSQQIPVMLRSLLNGDVMGLVEPFRPILDGTEFSDHPLHLYRDGKWNSDKDMIVGVTTEELADIEYIVPPGPDYEMLFPALNTYLFGPKTAATVIQKYENEYAPAENENWATTFGTEMTHLYFICPSRAMTRYASATAKDSAKVYFYADSHPVLEGSCVARNNTEEDCYYSTHSSEVRFLFRTRSDPTADDRTVEDQFSTYWGSFARTGSPSNDLEMPLGNFTDWPIYSEEVTAVAKTKELFPNNTWANILIKAPNSEVVDDFEENICDFWDSIGYYMDPIPLPTTTGAITTTNTEKTTVGNVETTTSRGSICSNSLISIIGALSLAVGLNNGIHSLPH